MPDPKKADNYHCPDCGVLVKSHDGLRSHKLFCDQVNRSLRSAVSETNLALEQADSTCFAPLFKRAA